MPRNQTKDLRAKHAQLLNKAADAGSKVSAIESKYHNIRECLIYWESKLDLINAQIDEIEKQIVTDTQ